MKCRKIIFFKISYFLRKKIRNVIFTNLWLLDVFLSKYLYFYLVQSIASESVCLEEILIKYSFQKEYK